MTPEKEKQLVERYPLVFRDVHERAPLTSSLMGFGCECADGWFQILWDLCHQLEPLIAALIEKHPDWDFPPRVIQIKEKYGTLRFYMSSESEEISKAISEAEHRSAVTCEVCGNAGQMCVRHRWYRTLCVECAKKDGYEQVKEEVEDGQGESNNPG